MAVIKFSLQDADDPIYASSYELFEEEDHVLTYYIVPGKNTDSIILNKNNSEHIVNIELDLLTQYIIYKDRNCDYLKSHFSRNLILNHLKNKYNELYKINYKSLMMLYVYLKVNLLNFPVKIPNQFLNREVTIDDDGNIVSIEPPDINSEELLFLIKNTVDDLYNRLLKFINMID